MRGRLASLLAIAIGACASPPPPYSIDEVAVPAASDVDAILFLVGDAGAARLESAPLVHRLRADVEAWSSRLGRDSAVVVAFLGDNVYPEGVRGRDHRDFPVDSARLYAQVWVVEGPEARRHGTRGLFVAGNHDWGNARDPEGLERLRNEERLLQAYHSGGLAVELLPAAGEPGPVVVDLGSHTRIVALDTHWWLQSPDGPRKDVFARDVAAAIGSAGARQVVVAAHHPNVSAGPHGSSAFIGLDPLWLLRRAGAVVQDLNAAPYRSLVAALGNAFETASVPVLYAAGHDHSLQVLRGSSASEPQWTLVSGAGSKLTGLGRSEALVWASREPGYMRLVVRPTGRVDLFVESAPVEHLRCPDDAASATSCVERGVAAFRTTYSQRLR